MDTNGRAHIVPMKLPKTKYIRTADGQTEKRHPNDRVTSSLLEWCLHFTPNGFFHDDFKRPTRHCDLDAVIWDGVRDILFVMETECQRTTEDVWNTPDIYQQLRGKSYKYIFQYHLAKCGGARFFLVFHCHPKQFSKEPIANDLFGEPIVKSPNWENRVLVWEILEMKGNEYIIVQESKTSAFEFSRWFLTIHMNANLIKDVSMERILKLGYGSRNRNAILEPMADMPKDLNSGKVSVETYAEHLPPGRK